jgi:hypothetical protein
MAKDPLSIDNIKNDNPTEYPDGYFQDSPDPQVGTKLYSFTHQDHQQFFSKLMRDAGLTYNGEFDREGAGNFFQLVDAAKIVLGAPAWVEVGDSGGANDLKNGYSNVSGEPKNSYRIINGGKHIEIVGAISHAGSPAGDDIYQLPSGYIPANIGAGYGCVVNFNDGTIATAFSIYITSTGMVKIRGTNPFPVGGYFMYHKVLPMALPTKEV